MAVTPTPSAATEQLPGGPDVNVRPMEPTDADALVRFHGRLSNETTYRRYFGVHPTLRPAELERFTHVDHVDREAVVACDGDGDIVGVGRYDRTPGTTEAEGAFVVRDDWQGLGLGGVLLRHVIDHAKANGMNALTAETLRLNRPMLVVFRRSGYPMTTRTDYGTIHVRLDLAGATDG